MAHRSHNHAYYWQLPPPHLFRAPRLFRREEYTPKSVSSFWNNITSNMKVMVLKTVSYHKYHNKIKPYLRDIIIDLPSSYKWKIQLTIAINFIFSKDTGEEHFMHPSSENIKSTPYNDANEVVTELFESLRSKYQDNLETLIRGSDFIFDSVQLMY